MQSTGLVVHANSRTFDQEVLKANLPVFVDFWAEWCGPCRYVGPIVEELARDYEGRMKFVKVNTDENPDIAARYEIYGIPTLIIFKDGQAVERIVGAAPKPYYVQQISKVLGDASHHD